MEECFYDEDELLLEDEGPNIEQKAVEHQQDRSISPIAMVCCNCSHYFGPPVLGWCRAFETWVHGIAICSSYQLR